MKEWILSVSVTVLVCGLIFLILPKSKISKAIKVVASFVTVFAIIKPLAEADVFDIYKENFAVKGEISLQEGYLEYTWRLKEHLLKNEIIKKTEESGIKLSAENIYIISDDLSENFFLAEGAEINLKNAVINTENEHINIKEEVKMIVSETLGIASDKVKVYER